MASSPQYIRFAKSPAVRVNPDRTVTADAATDRLTQSAHGLAEGDQITLISSGVAPGGLTVASSYFVRNPTANDFQVAATAGGTVIDITSAGTGPHVIRTRNSRLDGAGHLHTLYTAETGQAAQGDRIDLITVRAVGQVSNGMIRFFKQNGSAIRLLREMPVTATTPSSIGEGFKADFFISGGLFLDPGDVIRVASDLAEPFDVTVVQAGTF